MVEMESEQEKNVGEEFEYGVRSDSILQAAQPVSCSSN